MIKKEDLKLKIKPLPLLTAGLLLAFGALGFGGYQFWRLAAAERALNEAFLAAQEASNARFATLEQSLGIAASENQTLAENLRAQAERNAALETELGGRIENISGVVSNLEKLAKIDPELLQKYSRVFFLNEHYAPARLVELDKKYLYHEDRTERVMTDVWPFLLRLFEAAARDGITLYVKSAYRSFEEQANVKSGYSVIYGAGTANQFSAEQGYSEHQLGTTVDFITTGLGGQLNGFERTKAFTWLSFNAYKYGFALSYPPNNAYYIFEPWHWRFVGTALATHLRQNGKFFYDLDQREIDQYLIRLFD